MSMKLMAEAALVLSIKGAQTHSDTFRLSSLPAARPSLFTPASQSEAESAHTVRRSLGFHFSPSLHLTKGQKGR